MASSQGDCRHGINIDMFLLIRIKIVIFVWNLYGDKSYEDKTVGKEP